jgi:hypothetical protein
MNSGSLDMVVGVSDWNTTKKNGRCCGRFGWLMLSYLLKIGRV